MKKFSYVVVNPMGVHARPAALLAQLCVGLRSAVTIECNGKTAGGNNVLQVLALEAKKGDTLNVTVEGVDEEEAVNALVELVKTGFAD